VFLPPYSPDLNPIEFIWKSLRKEILKEFIESVTQLKNLIKNEYMKLAKSKSFANNWMKIFDEQIKSVMNSWVDYILAKEQFSLFLNNFENFYFLINKIFLVLFF